MAGTEPRETVLPSIGRAFHESQGDVDFVVVKKCEGMHPSTIRSSMVVANEGNQAGNGDAHPDTAGKMGERGVQKYNLTDEGKEDLA